MENLSEIRSFIRNVLTESLSELSTIQASSFLNVIQKHYPDKLNHYKNIIVKKSFGLKAAYVEFAKEVNKTPEQIEKIASKKDFGRSPGNPFGITGVNREYNQSDEMAPKFIELSDYMEKANELKALPLANSERHAIEAFFNPDNFEMVNNAIFRIAERHNKQLEQIRQGDLVNLIDPYSNMPIVDVNDPFVVNSRGAYYQDEDTAKKAINVQDARKKLETALTKKTISGLRWIITNSKLAGK